MKSFLMGIASFLFAMSFFLFLHDYNLNKYYLDELKFACEEASVAGCLFIDWEQYGEGKIVFNYDQSNKAIKFVISSMLKLGRDNMMPENHPYWKDEIEVKVTYYDESDIDSENVNICYEIDESTGLHIAIKRCGKGLDESTGLDIKEPSIIVEINAGKPNYRLKYLNINDNIRSSGHAWHPWGEDGI